MAIQLPAILKSYFLTGAKPSQSQFADVIDSSVQKTEAWYLVQESYQIDFTDVNTINATTSNIVMRGLSVNERLQGFIINNTVIFSGGTINSATLNIGYNNGAAQAYPTFNAFAAAGVGVGQEQMGVSSNGQIASLAGGTVYYITITIGSLLGTQRLNNLTQGHANIKLFILKNNI